LSLTSYSTVHSMIQLEKTRPAVTADDIVVLTYHPITNDFNVASAEMVGYLQSGFEQQLGDPDLAGKMMIPFGSLNGQGQLVVGQFEIACAERRSADPECSRPNGKSREAFEVTERAFDAVMAAHPAHFVVAFLSGEDSDPVITHLRSKGVTVADLRTDGSDSDASDEVSIDEHASAFWHHRLSGRLAEALRHAHLVD
jgi:hypothetical protein